MATKIPSSNTKFESSLPNITTSILDKPPKTERIQSCFLCFGYYKLHINVIRKLYHELKIPLMNIFSLSLKTGVFPEK